MNYSQNLEAGFNALSDIDRQRPNHFFQTLEVSTTCVATQEVTFPPRLYFQSLDANLSLTSALASTRPILEVSLEAVSGVQTQTHYYQYLNVSSIAEVDTNRGKRLQNASSIEYYRDLLIETSLTLQNLTAPNTGEFVISPVDEVIPPTADQILSASEMWPGDTPDPEPPVFVNIKQTAATQVEVSWPVQADARLFQIQLFDTDKNPILYRNSTITAEVNGNFVRLFVPFDPNEAYPERTVRAKVSPIHPNRRVPTYNGTFSEPLLVTTKFDGSYISKISASQIDAGTITTQFLLAPGSSLSNGSGGRIIAGNDPASGNGGYVEIAGSGITWVPLDSQTASITMPSQGTASFSGVSVSASQGLDVSGDMTISGQSKMSTGANLVLSGGTVANPSSKAVVTATWPTHFNAAHIPNYGMAYDASGSVDNRPKLWFAADDSTNSYDGFSGVWNYQNGGSQQDLQFGFQGWNGTTIDNVTLTSNSQTVQGVSLSDLDSGTIIVVGRAIFQYNPGGGWLRAGGQMRDVNGNTISQFFDRLRAYNMSGIDRGTFGTTDSVAVIGYEQPVNNSGEPINGYRGAFIWKRVSAAWIWQLTKLNLVDERLLVSGSFVGTWRYYFQDIKYSKNVTRWISVGFKERWDTFSTTPGFMYSRASDDGNWTWVDITNSQISSSQHPRRPQALACRDVLNNVKWISVGWDGLIMVATGSPSSSNNWSRVTSPQPTYRYTGETIDYQGNLYGVAVGDDGTNTNQTWVAVGQNYTTTGSITASIIYSRDNGVTWLNATLPSSIDQTLNSVTYFPDRKMWIAVGGKNSSGQGQILASYNGKDWFIPRGSFSDDLQYIGYIKATSTNADFNNKWHLFSRSGATLNWWTSPDAGTGLSPQSIAIGPSYGYITTFDSIVRFDKSNGSVLETISKPTEAGSAVTASTLFYDQTDSKVKLIVKDATNRIKIIKYNPDSLFDSLTSALGALSANISSTATSMSVQETVGVNVPSLPFNVRIDNEIITVGARSVSGSIATYSSLSRGVLGTTAATHSSGASVLSLDSTLLDSGFTSATFAFSGAARFTSGAIDYYAIALATTSISGIYSFKVIDGSRASQLDFADATGGSPEGGLAYSYNDTNPRFFTLSSSQETSVKEHSRFHQGKAQQNIYVRYAYASDDGSNTTAISPFSNATIAARAFVSIRVPSVPPGAARAKIYARGTDVFASIGSVNTGPTYTNIASITKSGSVATIKTNSSISSLLDKAARLSLDGSGWTSRTSGVTTDLNGIARSDSADAWVAVGSGGIIRSSANGIDWSAVSSGTTNNLNKIAYSSTPATYKWIAVGAGGTILRSSSSNGTASWTSVSGFTTDLFGVRYYNKWIATGAGGVIVESANGTSWSQQTGNSNTNTLYSLVASASQIIAVGDAGTVLQSSTGNGGTWTAVGSAQTAANGQTLRSIAYSASAGWIAVGTNGKIITSPDGTTWSVQNSNTTRQLNSVARSGNDEYWVVVGSGNTTDGLILTSEDGVTWTARTSNNSNDLNAVAHANNDYLWVTVGTTGALLSSPDAGLGMPAVYIKDVKTDSNSPSVLIPNGVYKIKNITSTSSDTTFTITVPDIGEVLSTSGNLGSTTVLLNEISINESTAFRNSNPVAPFYIQVDNEVLRVTKRTGSASPYTYRVERGKSGTAAMVHAASVTVYGGESTSPYQYKTISTGLERAVVLTYGDDDFVTASLFDTDTGLLGPWGGTGADTDAAIVKSETPGWALSGKGTFKLSRIGDPGTASVATNEAILYLGDSPTANGKSALYIQFRNGSKQVIIDEGLL